MKRKEQNEQKWRKTVGANIGRRARHREGPRACGLLRARFARHGLRRHYWCHPGVRQAGRGRPQGGARVEGSAQERTKTLLLYVFVAVMKFYYFILFLHIFSGTSGNDAGSWPTSARDVEGLGAKFGLTLS